MQLLIEKIIKLEYGIEHYLTHKLYITGPMYIIMLNLFMLALCRSMSPALMLFTVTWPVALIVQSS